MQVGKYAGIQVCMYLSMQCKYASMQVYKYVSIQVCKNTGKPVCKYASLRVCKYSVGPCQNNDSRESEMDIREKIGIAKIIHKIAKLPFLFTKSAISQKIVK